MSRRACSVYTIRSPGRDAWTLCSSCFCASSWRPLWLCRKCFEKKKKKMEWEKRHYLNIFLKCCEFICFSYLKRSGSVNCVYIFMVFTYRCNFFFFPTEEASQMRTELLQQSRRLSTRPRRTDEWEPSWTNLFGKFLTSSLGPLKQFDLMRRSMCRWHVDLFVPPPAHFEAKTANSQFTASALS